MIFKQVAILGPGLLGGSIALGMRKNSPGTRVVAWARRPEAAVAMQEAGFVELASSEMAQVIRGSDLIVLCTPIGVMRTLAEQIRPLLEPGALVTDVGSVKGMVVDTVGPILGSAFVGSHPMAGSDQVGIAAAREDLFEGAVCIVTPDHRTSPDAVARVSEFWRMLGGCVRELEPARHDRIVAWISHLPHLLAAALVNVAAENESDSLEYCGSGFRDTTRVASGPPGMWAEILEQNGIAMQQSLRATIEHLQELEKKLGDSPGIEQYLAAAKTARDRLKLPRAHGQLES